MRNKNKILLLLIGLFVLVSLIFIGQPRTESRSQYHSSQLKKSTFQDENTEKTDYVDNNGRITIAADLGYATIIVQKKDRYRTEYYYDDQGKPISRYSGYFALLREYNEKGENTTVIYLDLDGNPVIIANGYAMEKREYNSNGQITRVNYYDTAGLPILTTSYGNGKINEYDSTGKVARIIYIDTAGNPTMTDQGYAMVGRNYYLSDGLENGKVESEFYYDEKGKPVALSLGQYGVHKEYNSIGQETVLTYLNENGDPTVTNKGYTTVVRTYHANNTLKTERYYDLSGNPFALSEGQFGISRTNGQVVYLNKEGNESFNLKNLLYNQSWLVIILSLIALFLSNLTSKRWNVLLLILAISSIVYLTLLFRDNEKRKSFELFASYKYFFVDGEKRADVLKNIWLFIPFGAILYRLSPQKTVLLIPLALSALIEGIQYYTGTGFCELDDVISNCFGGWVGFESAKLLGSLFFRNIHDQKKISN